MEGNNLGLARVSRSLFIYCRTYCLGVVGFYTEAELSAFSFRQRWHIVIRHWGFSLCASLSLISPLFLFFSSESTAVPVPGSDLPIRLQVCCSPLRARAFSLFLSLTLSVCLYLSHRVIPFLFYSPGRCLRGSSVIRAVSWPPTALDRFSSCVHDDIRIIMSYSTPRGLSIESTSKIVFYQTNDSLISLSRSRSAIKRLYMQRSAHQWELTSVPIST